MYTDGAILFKMFDFKNSQDKELWRLGLNVFAQMSGAIAFPVLIALFVGRFLDQKYQSGHLYFFILTLVAFIISCISIGVLGMKYLNQINKQSKNAVVVPPPAGSPTRNNENDANGD